jgi:ribosomal protein L3 glutamine methyltransferase
LHLPPDTALEPFWTAVLTPDERRAVAEIIDARVTTRKPAPYLVNRAYIQGFPFYVDERVIVPRSFIGELLFTEGGLPLEQDVEQIESVLDLCTGSGCIAILAAHVFPNARIDAVDIAPGAIEVANRNVKDSGFGKRICLYEGDLFAPVAGRAYDLILTNPPYVDAEGMKKLPPEYRHEPALALGSTAGEDGLAIVQRIINEAAAHLNPDGALVCELGRCGPALAQARPDLGFLWLDTEHSQGEVFLLTREQLA